MSMNKATRGNFIFGLVLIVAFGAMMWYRGRDVGSHAPLAAFAEGLTLQQATDRAGESGRPVLVFATASWCGPCQSFKANTLSRDDVAEAILANFEPVYLDTDRNGPEAQSLRISGIPTVIVMRDGEQVDRVSGALPTRDFLDFLRPHMN